MNLFRGKVSLTDGRTFAMFNIRIARVDLSTNIANVEMDAWELESSAYKGMAPTYRFEIPITLPTWDEHSNAVVLAAVLAMPEFSTLVHIA